MGNSLRVVLDNYIGRATLPCHLQLGPSTSIDLDGYSCEVECDMVVVSKAEVRSMIYRIDEKRCQVQLLRDNVDRHGYVETVEYVFSDYLSGKTDGIISLKITETNYVKIETLRLTTSADSILPSKRNMSIDACGGVMDTTVHMYGSESMRGLLVVESKKKRREKEAEVVTVAHYIVKSSGTSFYRSTGTDIGLSVVARFRASNGKFQITVEGLEQHPVSALLYMFDEVNRTGIWKPTMCPHCDHKRRGKLLWQSDSEDSDRVSMPLPPATPRNARGVSNGGRFQGNGNGAD